MNYDYELRYDNLPNNYELAKKRANGLRKHMLRRPNLQLALLNFIQELKENKFIIPAEENTDQQTNYLPYFITNQAKPRVVYDGYAVYNGRDGPSMILFIPVLTYLIFWQMF